MPNSSPINQTNELRKGACYVPSFHFNSAKLCYCRSGKSFGYCCGSKSELRTKPMHLSIIPNFLSKTECSRLIRFAKKQKGAALTVVDGKKQQANKTVARRHSSRITRQVVLGRKQPLVNQWFKEACTTPLRASIGEDPQWFEMPHLLHYGPGGKYELHSDAEHFDMDAQRFYRFIDRDFSMLIYLNDDFTGGELNFPWLNYEYRPVAGDLVFFPSNHIFSHESRPIISGNKYALVTWGAYAGSLRVRQPRTMLPLA